MTIRLAIDGVSGRMGRALLEAIAADADCTLAMAIDRPGSPLAGQDAGVVYGTVAGVAVVSQMEADLGNAQALIDFTRPEATLTYLDVCVANKLPLVIGTTGFDAAGTAASL